MNEIAVLVKPYSSVVEGAEIDTTMPGYDGKVKSCYNCGSLLYYIVTSRIRNTTYATDTNFYCAVCGDEAGGIFDDPFNEVKPLEALDELTLTSLGEL